MANKKAKNQIDGFYISLSINVIAFILIIILWVRKRNSTDKTPQTINTIIQTKKQQKIQDNRKIQVIECYRQELKTIPFQSSSNDVPVLNKNNFQFHRVTQTDQYQPQLEQIKLLKDQLQIQRDRNQLLQSKQQKMEALLANFRNSGNKNNILPEEYQNVKNQLQFCQQKLNQMMKSQAQLKQKLTDYERMSISMLNHPEYQRLRQLNNKYKDTIVKLQSHLLTKQELKENYFEVSFHNL